MDHSGPEHASQLTGERIDPTTENSDRQSPEKTKLPLIAVIGPTGSGKSDMSLALAREFRGEIVNCDSLQIYRFFDIGTAKIGESERRGVRHHLLDVLDPDQVMTAGDFQRRGREMICEVSSRSNLPIITGGTGFYLRALLNGLPVAPKRDEALRARLAARESAKPGSLHRLLSRFDPKSASEIDRGDVPKTMRALEIYLLTGLPRSELPTGKGLDGYRALKILLSPPRDLLWKKLNQRAAEMYHGGLLEEVHGILARGYPANSKPFESVGYKQALSVVQGSLELAEAISETQRNTRHYAKRQLTWFRKEPGLEVLAGFGSDPAIQQAAVGSVKQFLNSGW